MTEILALQKQLKARSKSRVDPVKGMCKEMCLASAFPPRCISDGTFFFKILGTESIRGSFEGSLLPASSRGSFLEET